MVCKTKLNFVIALCTNKAKKKKKIKYIEASKMIRAPHNKKLSKAFRTMIQKILLECYLFCQNLFFIKILGVS